MQKKYIIFGLKKFASVLLLAIVIVAAFQLGSISGKKNVHCDVCKPEDINFSLFWETYQSLKEKFVDPAKIDTQKILYGAISGMVEALGDAYTVFFPPEESKQFQEDVKGVFEGIGIEIGQKSGQLQVVSPLEGTPAKEAGMKAGDKILEIDGVSTDNMAVEEAVKKIRGPKGTSVTLTVFREGWQESKEITIKRAVIEVPSLKLEFKETPGGTIAYLRLYQFYEKAFYDFQDAAISILYSKADKIILDLRDNPGGYLEVAEGIAGWFLDKDQVVTIEDFGLNQEQKVYRTNGNGVLERYPLVILINEGSASASEILAGALRDDRGIKLIGQTSFGKGSIQEMVDLSDGSSLKITIAKWLTPKGNQIQDKGLEPDIKVEIKDEDIKENRDPQLDKALEIIQNL